MSFCRFSEDAAIFDVTPIENVFLLEYLPTAPDDFLRVYLYARMLCLHPELGEGMESLARALRMDENAVFNAFSYWERQGMVRRLTDRPPTFEILPLRSGMNVSASPMERDYYEYREFNAALQSLFGSGNLLHPKEYKTANDWLNLLGFTQDAVLKMVEDRLSRSRAKKPNVSALFKKLNETAVAWAERGVRTAEDVERAILYDARVEQTANLVMKQFSMHRAPTVDELDCVRRWLDEWSLTQEEIIDACKETTKSRTPTIAYLNSILETRRKGGDVLFDGLKAVLRELGLKVERPSPDQLRSYGAMISAGFEPETIRLAAIQCNRKKKNRFEELEWMIGKWRELGLYTAAEAEAYVHTMQQSREEVRVILEKCGSERRPQMDDLALYADWRSFSAPELIDYAAECARGMQLPMRYIDKLLKEWRKSGVSTVDAARAEHEKLAAQRPGGSGAKPNPALDYEQREYKEEDFGDDFFIDLSKEQGNGGTEA